MGAPPSQGLARAWKFLGFYLQLSNPFKISDFNLLHKIATLKRNPFLPHKNIPQTLAKLHPWSPFSLNAYSGAYYRNRKREAKDFEKVSHTLKR